MGELANRRIQTGDRIKELKKRLAGTETILAEKACVYATGSFGRNEASERSDLDAFIVGKVVDGKKAKSERALSRLDEICVKADLIEVTRDLGIPDFDGDGQYLEHFAVTDLTETLGKPQDDATNTFTARLLLLLESRVLLGESVYKELTADIVAAYWKDYGDHKKEFVPAFLANDILRLWRTFCVNYEARTDPSEKAKRKSKNFTLKYSRMLTCFSALLYLLAIYNRNRTVHPDDAVSMIGLSPTQRLEWLLEQDDCKPAHDWLRGLLEQYESFLSLTNVPKAQLISAFNEQEQSKRYFAEANKFGDSMYNTLMHLRGEDDNRLFRLLLV